jgi:outer membrane protein OmpA-like peptidoglycan-associated protein
MDHRSSLGCALAALPLLVCGCAASSASVRDFSLHHVVLYQNGIGYFERTGVLQGDRLRLHLREREVDDVLKTLVVVEDTPVAGRKPSTVTALLPQMLKPGAAAKDPEEATWLDVVLSPRPSSALSLAFAVPTAAWKAAYRIVLPEAKSVPPGSAPPREALLQVWALVDNVSDEDWVDVQLTLATGAPFTFTTHLRDVRFVDRPEANPGQLAVQAPQGPVYAERTEGGDTDRDGIPDAFDACPKEPGDPDPDPKKNGCPKFIRRISGSTEIQILKVVEFAANSDVIQPAMSTILDEVVRLLKVNPEIKVLKVEGHASRGERGAADLSARRASKAKAYLVAHGVDPTRLMAEGFGEFRPIQDNATEVGKARNRRVEFHIAEQGSPPPPPAAPAKPAEAPPAATMEKMARSAAPSAIARAMPGALRYDIPHPVTLPKMSTTMVTIVNEHIPGEDVLLFRPDANVAGSDRHPFHAARIENRSGFGFQSGPVAIFGGGTFVGEGILEALGKNQTAYVPYGLDADATVRFEQRTDRKPVRIISLSKGLLTVEDELRLVTRYLVAVGDGPPARLFVTHPRTAGYEVDGPGPDVEVTNATILAPVALASGWHGEVAVTEARRVRDPVRIADMDGKDLEAYLKGSNLEGAIDKKLRDIAVLRREVTRLDLEMLSLRGRLADLSAITAELRTSLISIEKTPRAAALQQKLLDQLGEKTKESEKLSLKLSTDGADLTDAQARLVDALRDFSFEAVTEKGKP